MVAGCSAALISRAGGLEIHIDYSLDKNGFFGQPGSQEAMRAVCDYFESIITDNLARIDPAEWTGETWQRRFFHPSTGADTLLPGLVVPEDTIVLYVGGRNDIGFALGRGGPGGYSATASGADGRAWFELLKSRGQTGALLSPPTDYAPWGGSIAFNNTLNWNFSLTSPGGGLSFVSTALHEVAHVLGIGITDTSWFTYVTGSGFTGSASVASYGGNVPLEPDGGHWQNDGACSGTTGYLPGNPLNVLSKTVAQFGTPAGLDQIARLDSSGCQAGPFHLVMTELDLAGLADVGWEIASIQPEKNELPELLAAVDAGSGDVTLSWLANPALTYQVEEAQGLAGWADLGDPISGEMGMYEFIDSDPPTGRNFYRLEITPTEPGAIAFEALAGERTVDVAPRVAHGCKGCTHAP